MKTWLLTLLMILSLTPLLELKTSFNDNVQEAYDQYIIIEDYASPSYSIIVVEGLIKDKVVYGLMFFSDKAFSFTLRINNGRNFYYFKTNSRGDIFSPSFDMGSDFLLEVLDEAMVVRKSLTVAKISKTTFLEKQGILNGLGKGANLYIPKKKAQFLDYVMWGSGIIIFVAALNIFILYKQKKGIFNPENKKKTLFTVEENKDEVFLETTEIPSIETKTQDTNPFINQYEKLYDYEEEIRDYRDVLITNGIPQDYSLLSPNEKNTVMLKLMFLRDKKVLSLEEYRKEVIKLWKK